MIALILTALDVPIDTEDDGGAAVVITIRIEAPSSDDEPSAQLLALQLDCDVKASPFASFPFCFACFLDLGYPFL